MKKILMIEDEAALAQSLAFALDKEYQLINMPTGQAGFDYAKTDSPSLILLDINLPDIEGTEVLQKLQADNATKNIPVVVLTNLSDASTVSRILAAGGNEYIVKTDWSVAQIAKKIKDIVG